MNPTSRPRSHRALRTGMVALTISGLLVTTACSSNSTDVEGTAPGTASTATASGSTGSASTSASTSIDDVLAAYEDIHEPINATDAELAAATVIDLTAGTVDGDGAQFSDSTVTITAGGVYSLTGSTSDGQVVVDAADDDVTLILNGASITSNSTAAIYVKSADEVDLILAEGTVNSLTDATDYTYPDASTDEPKAALFVDANLTIMGSGELAITGRYGDGISVKDGLVIDSGTLSVTAVDDGIRGKHYTVINGGQITVDADDDGIIANQEEDATRGFVLITDGDVTVAAAEDGIQGETAVFITGGTITAAVGDDGIHAETDLIITDGVITITESEEGLEGSRVDIRGGTIDVTSADDGINAAGDESERWISISGGEIVVDALGDGIDANGALTISDGLLVIHGPSNSGNGALDADGELAITGGTVVALGAGGMEQAPNTSSGQSWISTALQSSVSAGTVISVADDSGNIIESVLTRRTVGAVIVSTPDVQADATYSVYASTADGGTTEGFGGLVDGVSVSGETAITTTTAGESAFGGGPGGGFGNDFGGEPGAGGGRPGGMGGTEDGEGLRPTRPEPGSSEAPSENGSADQSQG